MLAFLTVNRLGNTVGSAEAPVETAPSIPKLRTTAGETGTMPCNTDEPMGARG